MKILLVDDCGLNNSVLAHAAAAAVLQADEMCVHAAASHIELSANELPAHIQWMPPGRQIVQPLGFEEPFEMNVTPVIAQAADRQLQQLRAKAAAGSDAQPYGDFNHKDEGRAYLPKRFWWGGSDPKTGGIRADVEWTGAGAKAVREGELCCNSPSWRLHKVTKAFLGITHNVGGLVPRGAFHSIQAFAKAETIPARSGGPGSPQQEHQKNKPMTPEQEKQLADSAAAIVKITATVEGIATAQAKAKTDADAAAAKAKAGDDTKPNPELDAIKAELKKLNEAQVAQAKAAGSVKIQQAIKDGKIPAQAKATIDHLEGMYVANAKAADEFIDGLPVSAALKTIVANAKGGATSTTTTDEHEFIAKAKAYAKEKNITDEVEAQAKFAGTPAGRELYQAYSDSLGQAN